MNIVIIPGYGDRTDYIEEAIHDWPNRFGSKPKIEVFGWSGEAHNYDEKWLNFSEAIQHIGSLSIIGISAGASVALRGLHDFPDRVKRVVTICGPVHLDKMDPKKLNVKYPVLESSLKQLPPEIPAQRVMTLIPLFDEVVPAQAMHIEGADNVRMKMLFHAISIWWALRHHAAQMHEFIQH